MALSQFTTLKVHYQLNYVLCNDRPYRKYLVLLYIIVNINSCLEGPTDLICSLTLYCFLIQGDYDSESIVMPLIIQVVFQVSVEYTGGGGSAQISFT